jgi:hypothetical protein
VKVNKDDAVDFVRQSILSSHADRLSADRFDTKQLAIDLANADRVVDRILKASDEAEEISDGNDDRRRGR